MRRRTRLLFALLVFVLAAAGGATVTYRLLRPIETATVYFGPSARPVLVGVGRGFVYVDADGDGRFGPDEQIPCDGRPDGTGIPVRDPDGRTVCEVRAGYRMWFPDADGPSLDLKVVVRGSAEYRQYADVSLDPAVPGTAHFGGPLAVDVRRVNGAVHPNLKLRTGDEPTELTVLVGTIDPARDVWTVVQSERRADGGDGTGLVPAFPDGVRPVADIEFPPRTPGGPPVRRRYTLDAVC